MKRLLYWIVIFVVGAAAFLVYADTTAALEPMPIPSSFPLPTTFPLNPLNPVVNVPDANLRHALHDATGVPESEDLRKLDLSGLTGEFSVSDVSDAEGIQYCKNLSDIYILSSNLENLPSMAGMTNLQMLYLTDCGLREYPSGKLPTSLKFLSLSYNKLSSIPAEIAALTNLNTLEISSNKLKKLPAALFGMPHLAYLYARSNDLESIPNEACNAPALHSLYLADNNIYNLPDNIGTHLTLLEVTGNRITTLPASIGNSTTLKHLNISMNRFESLPPSLAGHTFLQFNAEFNFMDVSAGTGNRQIIDSIVCANKLFARQLKPVSGVTAVSEADRITLTWQPGEGGSSNGSTWSVEGYVVYQYTGEMLKLGDLDENTCTFTHTGLEPETQYDYRIGVDYFVSDGCYDHVTRGYTRASATTSALATPPPQAQEAAPQETQVLAEPQEAGGTEPPAATAQAELQDEAGIVLQGSGQQSLPVWAIVLICAGGAAVLGGAAAAALILMRRAKAAKNGK